MASPATHLFARPAPWLATLLLASPVAAQTIFVDRFESPGTGAPQPLACEQWPGELVAPAGFKAHDVAWEQAFNGYAYPLSGGPLAAIGSWTLRRSWPDTGPELPGRYLSIPLVPDGDSHKLEWTLVQFTTVYPFARSAESVFVSVSPCPGDFRVADEASSDPFERRACRKISMQGALYYGPQAATSNVCVLETGREHYINVLFADPRDGLTTSEHSCAGEEPRCEANFKHN